MAARRGGAEDAGASSLVRSGAVKNVGSRVDAIDAPSGDNDADEGAPVARVRRGAVGARGATSSRPPGRGPGATDSDTTSGACPAGRGPSRRRLRRRAPWRAACNSERTGSAVAVRRVPPSTTASTSGAAVPPFTTTDRRGRAPQPTDTRGPNTARRVALPSPDTFRPLPVATATAASPARATDTNSCDADSDGRCDARPPAATTACPLGSRQLS